MNRLWIIRHLRQLSRWIGLLTMFCVSQGLNAQSGALITDVTFTALPGGKVQIDVLTDGNPDKPRMFRTSGPDRIVLDLPEPWQVVPHAERVLRPGGILLAYTPSIMQASQTREALRGRWIENRTIEVLHRGWHVEGQAVRPDHRMVAHTGFLTVARFLGRSNERIARDG